MPTQIRRYTESTEKSKPMAKDAVHNLVRRLSIMPIIINNSCTNVIVTETVMWCVSELFRAFFAEFICCLLFWYGRRQTCGQCANLICNNRKRKRMFHIFAVCVHCMQLPIFVNNTYADEWPHFSFYCYVVHSHLLLR